MLSVCVYLFLVEGVSLGLVRGGGFLVEEVSLGFVVGVGDGGVIVIFVPKLAIIF